VPAAGGGSAPVVVRAGDRAADDGDALFRLAGEHRARVHGEQVSPADPDCGEQRGGDAAVSTQRAGSGRPVPTEPGGLRRRHVGFPQLLGADRGFAGAAEAGGGDRPAAGGTPWRGGAADARFVPDAVHVPAGDHDGGEPDHRDAGTRAGGLSGFHASDDRAVAGAGDSGSVRVGAGASGSGAVSRFFADARVV